MTPESPFPLYTPRRMLVLFLLIAGMAALLARGMYLQLYRGEFLQGEGVARHQRVMAVPAHRGMIVDRNGEPLAISTPVDSVWANPQELLSAPKQIAALARLLNLDEDALFDYLSQRATRQFVYLKRHVNPDVARRVTALEAPGVNLQREYRRFYPLGEVTAHLLGFTNIDDRGQEGLELAYDDWLSGEAGAKRVIRDRLGRIVEDVERIRPPQPGKNLTLSIDRRIQYLAYRELKAAIAGHGARSGSVVILDPHTGQVLAMANQPAFNPNNRNALLAENYRNRAVTDVFEPGSTLKPFTVAAALESGLFQPHTPINTAPGWLMVRGNTIQDLHDYGRLDVAGVIIKSSNVGITKIALALPAGAMWRVYRNLGFGQATGSGFPGEAAGRMTHYQLWNAFERATHAFGYGLSVTPLQLAQAYATIASGGLRPSVNFLAGQRADRERVLSVPTAEQVRAMLAAAVDPGGTGELAAVEGYRIAGKTGTVHKTAAGGGYAKDRYVSVFAGMAPASDPRLVMVVMINEPSRGDHFGGQVAAPVFSLVMTGALRLLNVPPDNLPGLRVQIEKIHPALLRAPVKQWQDPA